MDRNLATLTNKTLDVISGHTDALLGGALTPDQWREKMARTLIEHQAAAYMLGKGDKKLDLADQRIITDANKEQLKYLDGFVSDIQSGRYKDSEDGLRARANLYAGSLKTPYSMGQHKGIPLPFHPGQGSECMGACKCNWQITQLEGSGNYDAYWRMGATEQHCTTCPSRAAISPYQIRAGQLV